MSASPASPMTGWPRPVATTPADRLPPPDAVGRRSRSRIVAALLAALVLVVIGVRWGASLDSGRRVLIVTRPVAAGAVLTSEDLGVARLGRSGAGLIDADRARQIAGRAAAVDLLPGTPLIPAMLTETAVPGVGEAIVGVSVAPAALPAELEVGARVRVVGVPAADDPGAILAAAAWVLSLRADDVTGDVALSLLLAEVDADRVVRAAASSGVSLVLLARAGGPR